MIESLLKFFCAKNSQKKKKVRYILNNIHYNNETKEFTCKSASNYDKEYIVFYSSKGFEWKCNCEASTWYKYRTYETPEQRNSFRHQKRCIHIISAMIYEMAILGKK